LTRVLRAPSGDVSGRGPAKTPDGRVFRMSRRVLVVASGLAGMVAAVLIVPGLVGVAFGAQGADGKSGGPPPLVVDKDAPLLLDEPTQTQKAAAKMSKPGAADNAPCLVCHVNYKAEPLARQHAGQKIGCVKCHGDSFAHRNDENNTTPPEIMYPLEKIDKACKKCHPTHDVPPVKVIARWLARRSAKTDLKQIVCTDCHGQHRLKVRTVRWDKQTGKLIGRKKDGKPSR